MPVNYSSCRKFKADEDIRHLRMHYDYHRELWTDPSHPNSSSDTNTVWLRPIDICNRPKFTDGKPSRFDVIQGHRGDCWLASVIGAITLNEALINHVVPPDQSFDYDYIGAFHFRIWQFGSWYDVVVDDRLLVFKHNHKLTSIHSNRGDIFWAALLEKAYAKFYSGTTINMDILTGGFSTEAMQDFSGGIVEIKKPIDLDDTKIKWYINEVFSKNALVCCSFKRDLYSKGLFDKHSYSITDVFKTDDDDPDYHGLCLVRFMNPWGNKEWQGAWRDDNLYVWRQIDLKTKELRLHLVDREDGEFWMDVKDFVKYFESMEICHLGPGEYLECHYVLSNFFWRSAELIGEWVYGDTAVGMDRRYRYKNPQFKLVIEVPPGYDSNSFGTVLVIIELIQKLNSRRERHNIRFYIYSLNHLSNPLMPLNWEFFQNNSSLNRSFDFDSEGSTRSVFMTMNLGLGSYCIVPCTKLRGIEASFLLRVYSQSPVLLEWYEHYTTLSKNLPTEESNANESDKWLKMLFIDIAQGQDEIDWICLKEILEAAMNPSRSFFGLIKSCFKFICDIFENHLSLWSYNYYETEDVVFSKDDCRSMIAMLDDNHSSKLNFSEFSKLWNKICFWTNVYNQHRDEAEGYLTVPQLRDALSSIGYDLNKRTVHSLVYFYANEQGHIFLTDFIICGVTVETVLSLSQKEDVEDGKKIMFTLEEWVKKTLIL